MCDQRKEASRISGNGTKQERMKYLDFFLKVEVCHGDGYCSFNGNGEKKGR